MVMSLDRVQLQVWACAGRAQWLASAPAPVLLMSGKMQRMLGQKATRYARLLAVSSRLLGGFCTTLRRTCTFPRTATAGFIYMLSQGRPQGWNVPVSSLQVFARGARASSAQHENCLCLLRAHIPLDQYMHTQHRK